jgi:hypothetical protein
MGSTTKTESESKLPQWQEDFIRNQILPKAESIGSTPFSAYTGDRVAGLSDLEKQAQSTMAGYDYGQPAYQQAQSVFSQISGMTPQDYAAMNQQNMNPYQDKVINSMEDVAAAVDGRRRVLERQILLLILERLETTAEEHLKVNVRRHTSLGKTN